jgi:uncharacterized protein DUF3300
MRRGLGLLLSLSLFLTASPEGLWAMQDASAPPTSSREPQYGTKTPEQLQQLVAPVALYPDSLVAQILSAATFPEQVVEADRWLQTHPNLKGDALAKAVDQQRWDPSVKALTAFPSVLAKMDKDLSWTSTLGDTYYNQPEDVMAAVQVMRKKAQQAGNLKTTQQQVVTTEGSTIIIEPASTEVVYVPEYDATVVYYEESDVAFVAGVAVGFLVAYEWGWGYWGCDWHHYYSEYHHDRYYSRSTTYYNRNNYYYSSGSKSGSSNSGSKSDSGSGSKSGSYSKSSNGETSSREGNRSSNGSSSERGSTSANNQRSSEGDNRANRGYGDSRGESNTRTGGFSNYNHGGEEKGYSQRGRQSFGGGGLGGSHGGGFPGGGFHGGPPHR